MARRGPYPAGLLRAPHAGIVLTDPNQPQESLPVTEPPRHNIMLPLRDGLSVSVPDELGLITPYVVREQRGWFETEYAFVAKLVKPGSLVLDIGANYGLYTLELAKRLGPQGRLYAFEPASSTAQHLAWSLASNGLANVRLVQAALGAQPGEAQLEINLNSELNSLLVGGSGPHETVRVATLDQCMREYGWDDVAFIKLDAEGMESAILAGGAALLEQHAPIVMYEIKHGAQVNHRLVSEFAALGYRSFRLVPTLGVLAPVEKLDEIDGYTLNLFACKPARIGQLRAQRLLFEPPTGDVMVRVDPKLKWPKNRGYFPVWEGPRAVVRHAALPNEVNEAIGCFLFAAQDSVAPEARYYSLRHAANLLEMSLRQRFTLPSLCTYIRVLGALETRAGEVQLLERLIGELEKVRHLPPGEPFLPCCPRFDTLPIRADFHAWMLAGALEQFERRRAYSSYYTPVDSHRLLQRYLTLGYASEEMLARQQLVALTMAGKTVNPTS